VDEEKEVIAYKHNLQTVGTFIVILLGALCVCAVASLAVFIFRGIDDLD